MAGIGIDFWDTHFASLSFFGRDVATYPGWAAVADGHSDEVIEWVVERGAGADDDVYNEITITMHGEYIIDDFAASYLTDYDRPLSLVGMHHLDVTLDGGMGGPIVMHAAAKSRRDIALTPDEIAAAVEDGRAAGLDRAAAITAYVNGAGAPPSFAFHAVGSDVTSSAASLASADVDEAYGVWDVQTHLGRARRSLTVSDTSVTNIYGRVATRPLVKAARHGRPDAKPEGTAARCGACAARDPAFLCTGCRVTAYCGTSCQAAVWPVHAEMCGE